MIALALALSAAFSEGLAIQPVNSAQCELALQITRERASHDYGKPVVFATSPPNDFHVSAEALSGRWTNYVSGNSLDVTPPPAALVEQFASSRRNAVSVCVSVRKWLAHHRVGFGKVAVKSVRVNADDELSAGILTVGLPVVSDDGQTALVYLDSVWGGEAGGGHVYLYRRRERGIWEMVGQQELWIS